MYDLPSQKQQKHTHTHIRAHSLLLAKLDFGGQPQKQSWKAQIVSPQPCPILSYRKKGLEATRFDFLSTDLCRRTGYLLGWVQGSHEFISTNDSNEGHTVRMTLIQHRGLWSFAGEGCRKFLIMLLVPEYSSQQPGRLEQCLLWVHHHPDQRLSALHFRLLSCKRCPVV